MTAKKKLVASQKTSPLVVINRRQLANSIMEALEMKDRQDAVVYRLYELQIVITRIIECTVSSIGKSTPEIISLLRGLDEDLVVAFLRYETASKAAVRQPFADLAAELSENMFHWKNAVQAALNGDVKTLQEFIKTQTTEPIRKQIEEIQAISRAGRPLGLQATTETLGKLAAEQKAKDPTERWQNIAVQVIAILKESPADSPEGDALKLLESQPYSKQGNFLKERHRLYLNALKRLAV